MKKEPMTKEAMKQRTKAFGLRVIKFVDSLPNKRSANVIGGQLLRSATSVGANYRSSLRGRSRPEFVAKLGIVEEEADESAYWIEMLIEAGHAKQELTGALLQEANELISIIVATIKSTKRNGLGTHRRHR